MTNEKLPVLLLVLAILLIPAGIGCFMNRPPDNVLGAIFLTGAPVLALAALILWGSRRRLGRTPEAIQIPSGSQSNSQQYQQSPNHKEAKGYWEVKSDDGSLRQYSEVGEIVDAVMATQIKPEDECRHIDAPDQSGKRRESKWKKVSDSLAKSSFSVRVLFQPVWAHTVRGAGVGAATGIMFWLACGVYLFIAKGVNFPAAIIFAFFFIVLGYGTVETIWQIKKEGFLSKVFVAAIIALVFFGYQIGVGPTLEGVFFGLQAQFGATVAGALAGMFPGMILGSIVGLIRQGNLRLAPTAQPENRMAILVKGIIFPSVLLACVAAIYITFMPKLAEILAK